MVLFDNSPGTTPCPNCGEPMGMVSWVGEKPVCAACAGATTTGFPKLGGGPDFDSDNEESCLHDALEKSLPPNQRGGPHNLACNCPKCTPIV